MSPLQIGLIIAGVVLVIGVLLYNWWQERRVRRRIDSAFGKPSGTDAAARPASTASRIEPSLRQDAEAPPEGDEPDGDSAVVPDPGMSLDGGDAAVPMDIIAHVDRPDAADVDSAMTASSETATARVAGTAAQIARAPGEDGPIRRPDPEIECVVTLQPARPLGAGALAAGLHARVGKRLTWYGRSVPDGAWQPLASDTRGEFVELAACMLLADRNGAASRAQLDTFVRVIGELAPLLPAAVSVPDVGAEADRAETLDRLCADVDVQIGLTVIKADANSIPGTRLRGVAEAAGFRLASGGRFELVAEDTGAVLYTLQNLRNEPFTVDTLRQSATNGLVLILDVPRVSDPMRVFDQMKLAARRLAQQLGCELVDDNRRPLDDTALAAIRKQVGTAAEALRDSGIEPGSSRALALFGA